MIGSRASHPQKFRNSERGRTVDCHCLSHCSLHPELWQTWTMGNKDKGRKETKKAPKPKPKPEPSRRPEVFTPAPQK